MKKVIATVTGLLTAALSNFLAFLVNLVADARSAGHLLRPGEALAEEATSLLPLPGIGRASHGPPRTV
jgi:hypothetical protein